MRCEKLCVFVRPVTDDSQPRVSYNEAYNATLERMENLDLNGGQFTRQAGLTSLLLPRSPISNIKGTTLIVEFCESNIREPNILVTKNGDMKIIDFDWCGKDGEVRYPSDISLGVGAGWDPDVTCGGLIRKDHDRSMYFRLTGLKWSEGEV